MTVQGAGVVPGTETPAAGAAGAAAAPVLTPEQVETLLGAAETQDQIVAALNQLATNQQRAAAPPAKGGAKGGEPDDVSELLSDPKGVIGKYANDAISQVLNTKLGPHLVAQAQAQRLANIDSQTSRIDTLYGEGFFDKEVRPLLVGKDGKTGALSAMSLADQALPENVSAAADGILGTLLARNPEVITKALTAQATKRTARERTLNPPKTLGAGIPRGTPANQIEIPENVEDTLQQFARIGIKFTKDDLVAAATRGNSLEDWDDAFPAPKPNAGKAA